MPNMSYCRFQNTKQALQDCADNLALPVNARDSNTLDEKSARADLVIACVEILEELKLDSGSFFRHSPEYRERLIVEALQELDGDEDCGENDDDEETYGKDLRA